MIENFTRGDRASACVGRQNQSFFFFFEEIHFWGEKGFSTCFIFTAALRPLQRFIGSHVARPAAPLSVEVQRTHVKTLYERTVVSCVCAVSWEEYVWSQEGPTQCCQDAGFSRCRQCFWATGAQLLAWTQSTFRDWKPRPQAAVQGRHGPARQHASQAPDEQLLPEVDLPLRSSQSPEPEPLCGQTTGCC